MTQPPEQETPKEPQKQPPRQSLLSILGRRLMVLINIGIFVFIIGSGAASYYAFQYFKSPGALVQDTQVIIPNGSSTKAISNLLAEKQIIENPLLFSIIVRLTESGKYMRAGEYAFQSHISPMGVFGILVSGRVVVHSLTVPEGWMTSQIVQLLASTPGLTGELPADVREGELLPETYYYSYGDSRAALIGRMRQAMQKTLDAAWDGRDPEVPVMTKEEALVLASIIEKETSLASERPEVAAVFANRLRKKMRLQTDPTVIYAVTGGEYVLARPLYLTDLARESPYNTYRIVGLPPGPIANPGKASIIAALHPAQSDALYFVANGTGGHSFAATLKEHNENVKKWRAVNKEKNGQ